MAQINTPLNRQVAQRLEYIDDIHELSTESDARSREAKDSADKSSHLSDVTAKQLTESLKEGDQPAETQAARVNGVTGEVSETLPARLDKDYGETTAQLAHTEQNKFKSSLVNHKKPKGYITLVDDDGHKGVYTKLAPLLRQYRIKMTSAVITDRNHGFPIPGLPAYNPNGAFMSYEMMRELYEEGLIEFVCHTHTHNINHRLTDMTVEEMHHELKTNQDIIRRLGWNHRHLVYPFGSQNAAVRDVVRQYFDSAFVTSGGVISAPFDQYRMNRVGVDAPHTANDVKARIDEAVRQNTWVVLMTHVDQYGGLDLNKLREIIEYALSQGYEFVTVEKGIQEFGNLAQFGNTTICHNGKIHGNELGKVKIAAFQEYRPNAPMTDFEPRKITIDHSRLADMAAYNLPNPVPGVVTTYRHAEDQYSYQTYTSVYTSSEHRVWYRRWDWNNKVWGKWYTTNGYEFAFFGEYPNNAPMTAFPINKVIHLKVRQVDASEYNITADTSIGGIYGKIEVYRDPEEAYSYQKFTAVNRDHVFYRTWNRTNNTWNKWSAKDFEFFARIDDYENNAPITDFPYRKIIQLKVRMMDAADYGLPSTYAGIIEVYRDPEEYYSYQKFVAPRQKKELFRYWDLDNNRWSSWSSAE
ncbi:polysaccharide deacetylase family protein [Shouchella patagoniensis]|uniref:polysaccharide deacetylase family protein n=1 Tax=Shouchella patagoniensis TaxID=228576 RepID=UPI000995BBAB|nr:polysaccharide deacetylase family protein [Shouchella patagoniensis]